MALTTRYQTNQIVIADNPSNMVFGTAMLGRTYGEVISASVAREADLEEIIAAGSILAAVLTNPKFTFKFKVMFRANVTPPGLAELITFPLANISGRILPPITIDWEEKGHRQLSIEATSWDGFSASSGGGTAYRFNGTTYNSIS